MLNSGTVEQWKSGTLELWNSGTLELWNSGTLELWNCFRHKGNKHSLNLFAIADKMHLSGDVPWFHFYYE